MTLLKVTNVSKSFPIEGGLFRSGSGFVKALDYVSVSMEEGKVLGVVGESGSGKTTLGKLICRLIIPDQGSITLYGRDIESFNNKEFSEKVQMIFQDPFASLNPKLSIHTILTEAAFNYPEKERQSVVADTLKTVKLPENILCSYPHQFSGGQRQRIAIARALIKKPKLIVADEPLSSLDLTIQSQLMQLFMELKETRKLSFMFISHDLAVTANLSDYLVVMQNGKIVEEGETGKVICYPEKDYTKRLLEAVPKI